MKKQVKFLNILQEYLYSDHQCPFVLLETSRFDKNNKQSLVFNSFVNTVVFRPHDDINDFFDEIDSYRRKGYWLAGYFSYEFGYMLEEKLACCIDDNLSLPLAWLGAFNPPIIIQHNKSTSYARWPELNTGYTINNIKTDITEKEYMSAVKRIKKYIEAGDTYQVNFTFNLNFDFQGDVRNLYSDLRKSQPTSYMAYINTGNDTILSFSPELFLSLKQGKITTRPMKGTMPRGRFVQEDNTNQNILRNSAKNKAENLMIVDLLRNDLGRVARTGTVDVSKLFSIEKYPSIFQMTSTIHACIEKNKTFKNIIDSLFPCGSVTGAPKIRTMQIIRELEKNPRGVYCGAIGYLSPYKDACFNVAIRTVHIDNHNRGKLGIGGGIVYDSVDKQEYDEALLKSHFLTRKVPEFSLVETIRFSREGYYLLDLHMARLKDSCRYFSIPFCYKEIQKRLCDLECRLNRDTVYRVRLLVSADGNIQLQYEILNDIELPVTMQLSSKKILSDDIYVYHKTTHREFLDKARQDAIKKGMGEVIFTNMKGELTEGSFTNIFLLQKGMLYTPSLQCGLLRGVLREHLLQNNLAKEKILYPADINTSGKVFIGNSVRGLMEATVAL